jgi:hypothetical protein
LQWTSGHWFFNLSDIATGESIEFGTQRPYQGHLITASVKYHQHLKQVYLKIKEGAVRFIIYDFSG